VSAIIAVTGATGFIGRRLTEAMVARGLTVRAIVRPGSLHEAPPGAAVVHAPLEEAPLVRAFRGAEAVVHLAGVVLAARPQGYAPVNVEGTRAVAAAAREAGAHLVHISSLAAAGAAPATAPRSEADPCSPVTPYGVSKLASEQVVTATTGLRWTTLRPGVVYGPGDRAVLTLFRAVRLGFVPLLGNPDAAYTFIHVDDCVRAIVAAIERRLDREVLFVGHPEPVRPRELLESIERALGRRAVRLRVPNGVGSIVAHACDAFARVTNWPVPLNRWRYREMCAEGFVCRVDRLRDRLGVAAQVALDTGIADTARWYREHGWLR
jgi:nucleoside-diphosphate-sugar epimerase